MSNDTAAPRTLSQLEIAMLRIVDACSNAGHGINDEQFDCIVDVLKQITYPAGIISAQ